MVTVIVTVIVTGDVRALPMVLRFFKGYALLEVTRPREVALDLTFLTGFTNKIYMVE